MLKFSIKKFSQDDWESTVSGFADLSLLQCWEYGEAKAVDGWQVERGVITENDVPCGAAQVMIRKLPFIGGGLAWISRGPLWRPHDENGSAKIFSEIHAALVRHYVEEKGYYLRVAPVIEESVATNAILSSSGFNMTDTPGWASAKLDLTFDEDTLRQGLSQKWRNALNKAERSDFEIEKDTETDQFDKFLIEYREFVSSRGFETAVSPSFLESLQSLLPKDRKLTCYRAHQSGKPLGSVLIVHYGDTSEYLAGTSLEAGRAFNVGQLLLWRALCDAKITGRKYFDLGGMDPQLTPKGIFNFKAGLGGSPYRLINEIEAHNGSWRSRLVRWRVNRTRQSTKIEVNS